MLASHPRPRAGPGFTLVEIAVVLVVLGILVIIAAPNLAGYIRSTKVDRALNEFTSDVAYTRMLAIRSGSSATLTIQPGGTGYTVQAVHMVAGNPVTRVAKQVNLSAEYRGVSLTPASTVLTFSSRGLLVSASSVDIVAQQGTTTSTLTVLQTGRAYREY